MIVDSGTLQVIGCTMDQYQRAASPTYNRVYIRWSASLVPYIHHSLLPLFQQQHALGGAASASAAAAASALTPLPATPRLLISL